MKGRIKRGAPVYYHRTAGKWPFCPEMRGFSTNNYEARDPDVVFEVSWEPQNEYWVCTVAECQPIQVRGFESVQLVELQSISLTKAEVIALQEAKG